MVRAGQFRARPKRPSSSTDRSRLRIQPIAKEMSRVDDSCGVALSYELAHPYRVCVKTPLGGRTARRSIGSFTWSQTERSLLGDLQEYSIVCTLPYRCVSKPYPCKLFGGGRG
jgi:hypothetical protein